MRQPTALGCYIFAGGFTLGVKQAGFRVLAQLEDGLYGVATTRRNHPDVPVHPVPDEWPLEAIAERAGGVGELDFLYGNPPCAPFSNAAVSIKKVGKMQNHWRTDPRAGCIRRMFGALERVRPKVWAWESVQPALKRGRPLVDELTEQANALGYHASYVLMNAVDLGVSQIRRRFFCVFHRVAIDWYYPGADGYKNRPTVRDAWRPILEDGWVDESPPPPGFMINRWSEEEKALRLALVHAVPQGGSLRRAWEEANPVEERQLNPNGTVKGRPRFLDVRLAWDAPSPTLTGGATKYHPEEDRYITLLEQQLLCGYPPSYVFEGPNLSDRYAQTAQAVMPPVGRWLAENVARAVVANQPLDRIAFEVVDLEKRRKDAWLAQFEDATTDVPPHVKRRIRQMGLFDEEVSSG